MSICTKPTQNDINKYCNRRNGLSLLNFIPVLGPVIANAAGKSGYFNGKISDYQSEVTSVTAQFAAETKEWQKITSEVTGENVQNIHNLINLLFGDGISDNGYIDALVDKKTFPLWEFAGYTAVTVICIIIILSVLIVNE